MLSACMYCYSATHFDVMFVHCVLPFRARCFRSEEEKDHFYNLPNEEKMSLEYILETLIADLVAKKRYAAHG